MIAQTATPTENTCASWLLETSVVPSYDRYIDAGARTHHTKAMATWRARYADDQGGGSAGESS